jgi:hypothetical protein
MSTKYFTRKNYHEFDTEKLTAGSVKKNDYNFLSSPLRYDNAPCMIETPRMRGPFGINTFSPNKGVKAPSNVGSQTDKYSLLLSFDYVPLSIDNPSIDMKKQMEDFVEVIRKCDSVLERESIKYHTEFGIPKPMLSDPEYYRTASIIKKKNEKTGVEYTPSIRIHLPFYEDRNGFTTKFIDGTKQLYDKNTPPLTQEEILKTLSSTKGYQFKCQLKLMSIQKVQNNTRLQWVAESVKFFPPEKTELQFDDDDEYLATDESREIYAKAKSAMVDDSEGEEDHPDAEHHPAPQETSLSEESAPDGTTQHEVQDHEQDVTSSHPGDDEEDPEGEEPGKRKSGPQGSKAKRAKKQQQQ